MHILNSCVGVFGGSAPAAAWPGWRWVQACSGRHYKVCRCLSESGFMVKSF
ncbi:hypothetical protein HMPREF9370_0211 [Neisseria wadsworthii 9715]|uniref:Uncharacterized protein n=1 Tax=Neisseria wadsworthii 9715 TaxID=1030841 RepID=G4CMA2_9NEIS|nr:hypothetical protein HMPREF9370_0211 [Neisseria wadsworthii 9715]